MKASTVIAANKLLELVVQADIPKAELFAMDDRTRLVRALGLFLSELSDEDPRVMLEATEVALREVGYHNNADSVRALLEGLKGY